MVGVDFKEKEKQSRQALRLASEMSKEYYGEPLVIAYSGGKDSDVMLDLAEKELSVDDFIVANSHTTVDAPETVYHIRNVFKRLEDRGVKTQIIYPEISMWRLIVKKGMPPTRLQRYCCKELKEISVPNRLVSLGVRAEESKIRKGRDTFGVRGATYQKAIFFSLDHAEEVHRESMEINDSVWDCTLIKTMKEHKDTVVNPIYEWTKEEIWFYIRQNSITYNPMYDRGYDRVGCIGCPMGGYASQIREFADYPKYKDLYINAFDRMIEEKKRNGKPIRNGWETGKDVFDWWIGKHYREVKGQMTLEDYLKESEVNNE